MGPKDRMETLGAGQGPQREPLIARKLNDQITVVQELRKSVDSLFPRFKAVLRPIEGCEVDKVSPVPTTGVAVADAIEDHTRILVGVIESLAQFKNAAEV